MHAIQRLRRQDPDLRAALARRPGVIDWGVFDDHEVARAQAQKDLESHLAKRRQVAEDIGLLRRKDATPDQFRLDALLAEGADLATLIPELEQRAAQLLAHQLDLAYTLPNAPLPIVPDGAGEAQNRCVRVVGAPVAASPARDHVSVAHPFCGFDFEVATQMSGSRFSIIQGSIASLHRALIQMMMDIHVDAGFKEVYVPYLVRGQALFGTGQLPKFEEDLFRTQDDLYLIPTAEVPVTNLIAGRVLQATELPLAWVAHTPCFRREAGSGGRDVKGLIRQHQFEKVELVRVEHPDRSEEALVDHILAGATRVLDALQLPYRVMELCVGDMGFASQHTYDVEVWMPGQGQYREISSCSNMGDFQSRRMEVRLKDGNQKLFPHTLNGSALAVGRTLAAILENHVQDDGRLWIPAPLRPYLRGQEYLCPPALI